MRRLSCFTLFLVLSCLAPAGCGDDGGGGDGDGDGDGDVDAAGPSVAPRTGTWDYDEYDTTGGSCDLSSQLNSDGQFGLVYEGGALFQIIPGDGTAPFNCNLSGASFDCPDRATATYSEQGVDALVSGQARVDGNFATAESASGVQTVDVACTGSDCAVVATALGTSFPCTFEADFTASWRDSL